MSSSVLRLVSLRVCVHLVLSVLMAVILGLSARLYTISLSVLLPVISRFSRFCLQLLKSVLYRPEIRRLTSSLRNTRFPFFPNVMSCVWSAFRTIIHLHCEPSSCQLCSISLNVILAPYNCNLTVTAPINTSEPVPPADTCSYPVMPVTRYSNLMSFFCNQ